MATFCHNQQCCEDKCDNLTNNNKKQTVSKELLNVNPKRGMMERYMLKNRSKTFKPAISKVLNEVKAFVEKSEDNLENRDMNIEDVDENQPYISMDIQLVKLGEDSSNSETSSDNEDFSPITCNIMMEKQNNKNEPTIEHIT